MITAVRHHRLKQLSGAVKYCFRAALVLYCTTVVGEVQARALAVISGDSEVYYHFLSSMGKALGVPQALNVRTADQHGSRVDTGDYDVVVVAGLRAAMAVAKSGVNAEIILYALIPKRSYEWLYENNLLVKAAQQRVLYFDQPLQRHLYLCRTILGDGAEIAILYSEYSKRDAAEVERLARTMPISVQSHYVADNKRLVSQLAEVLDTNDALLVLADPELYNERTAKAILLTAFRAGKPLISYSESLVQAGGLAAVVSSPDELGRQAGEILTCLMSQCDTVATLEKWPRYYSVELNNTIAGRLGLNVQAGAILLDQITKLERLEANESLEY